MTLGPDIGEGLNPKEVLFKEAADAGILRARQIHKDTLGPDSSNPQIFHGWNSHMQVLLERVDRIYKAVGKVRPDLATPHSQNMARLLVAWHDIVQDYDLKNPSTLQEERQRKRGYNEDEASYILGEGKNWLLNQVNFEQGRLALLDQDLSIIPDETVRTVVKEDAFVFPPPKTHEIVVKRAEGLDTIKLGEVVNRLGYSPM